MAKTASKSDEKVIIEYADWSGFLPWLTQAAFVVALAAAMARCLMLETLRDVTPVVPDSAPVPAGPGAGAIVWLNLICCLPAILVLLRRAVDRTYYLHTSIPHWMFGLLGLMAPISAFWAADKFAAMIHGSTLLAAAALAWAATQIVRSWTRLRMVAAACFCVLMVCCAQGLIYRFIDHPDNVAYWERHKAEELARRGWTPDSFAARQFEGKLLRGEMIGFFSSPNSMAAVMVFMGIVAAGVAVQRWSDRDEPGWAGSIIAMLVVGGGIIFLTQSKTAYLTPVLAAGMLMAVPRMHDWMLANRRKAFGIAMGLIALGVIAVIGHGLYHNALPSDSLNFRWKYWSGSWGAFMDHAIIGTGWANFGFFYLAHRLPEAAEEIKDPHNLFVRFFVELGIVGGVLAIGWLKSLFWFGTAPSTPPEPSAKTKPQQSMGKVMAQILPIILLALLINSLAAIDFSQESAFVLLELLKRLLWVGLMLLGFAVVVLRSSKDARLDDRPAPWVLWAMLVGLLIFLLHNMVDFSFFEAGPMMMFALLMGAVLGARNATVPGMRRRSIGSRIVCALAIIAWLGIAIFIALPLRQAEAIARVADANVREGNFRLAAARYKDAFDAFRLNGEWAEKSAECFARVPDAEGMFAAMALQAHAANPKDPAPLLLEARYYIHQGQALNKSEVIGRAFRQALALDPMNVSSRLEYADFLAGAIERDEALKQYKRALEIDDQLDAQEPKRLSEQQKAAIQEKIQAIEKTSDDEFAI